MDTTSRAVRVARGLCALGLGFASFAALAVPAEGSATSVRSSGELTRYVNPYPAPDQTISNPILEGATARVHAVEDASGRTIITLHVKGLPANREFGSHVHVSDCNTGKAGAHYRNTPGTNPEGATPENEVWLDFETNDAGNATAKATVAWTFRPGDANAVVIHDEYTTPSGGNAGKAGAKLACLDVDF